jgi:cation diffusion facilitator family transporter
MADDCCSKKGHELAALSDDSGRRRVLVIVLCINAAMFVLEFGGGIVAGSSALMADSVDMLGDAFVYGISLYALVRGPRWKAGAAIAKGLIILAFGIAVGLEVLTKIGSDAPPSSTLMLVFSAIALAANLTCLYLLWSHRRSDVNMASTYECSRNDVIANVGVFLAGGLVYLFRSVWPDVLVASLIAFAFLWSAIRVLRSGFRAWQTGVSDIELD